MRIRSLVVASTLGLCLIAVGCTNGDDTPRAAVELPSTPGALPRFDLASFRQLLSKLHGKPVVVNVWASWCGPCNVEADALQSVARETAGKTQFLGVDILDAVPAARAHIDKYHWTFPSVFDPSGGIRDGLGLLGQPNTVIFDRNGKQVWVRSGPVTVEELHTELRKLQAT